MTDAERIRELEDEIIAMIEERAHRYQGYCPDTVEGTWSRDPECPACQRLERLIGHRKPGS